MKWIGLAALTAAIALGACTNTVTVRGRAPATGETFQGVTDPGFLGPDVGPLVKAGHMTFASSNGPICRGAPQAGETGAITVAVTCDDGRSGTLSFPGPAPTIGAGKIGTADVTMIIGARGPL